MAKQDKKPASPWVSSLEFSNFICKFGEQDLLDYAEEIVIPAFTDTSLSRENRGGRYFLMNTDLRLLDESNTLSLALVGRLVRETEVRVAQYYDQTTKRLVLDDRAIPNAPSAIFALLLSNHILLYLRETPDAPGIESFGNTMQFFLRKKRALYLRDRLQSEETQLLIRERVARLKEGEVPHFRKEARGQILGEISNQTQQPTVEIVPLMGALATKELFAQIETLKELNIRFVTPNGNEIGKNAKKALQDYFGDKEDLNADSFSIGARNEKGLNLPNGLAVVDAALESANAHVRFTAVKRDGEEINGEDFRLKLKRAFPFATQTISNLSTTFRQLFAEWSNVEEKKLVKLDATAANPEQVHAKIEAIHSRHSQG